MGVRALPRPLTLPWWTILNGIGVAALALFWLRYGLLDPHLRSDGWAYWEVRDGILYEGAWLQEQQGLPNPYVYSPAFAQAIWPLTQLSIPAFMAAWVAIQLGAVTLLAGPILAAVFVWLWAPLGLNSVWAGQILPLMALALALAPRYPAAWSFLLLTKVTPGVGLVWHAARGEWRNLGIALGVTLGIAVVSALITPADWLAWAGVLRESSGTASPFQAVPLPLPIRLALAAVLIAFGARRDWWWALPAGVTLAQPHFVWGTVPILFLASLYWLRRPLGIRSVEVAHEHALEGRVVRRPARG